MEMQFTGVHMLSVTVIVATTAINLLAKFLPLGSTAIQAVRLAVIAGGWASPILMAACGSSI
jgi:hypothetical protein